ncbi:hypothetical protein DSCA_43390 [Desulfosarcina alkanivorans]|uniref:Uncharacterized protein n=1 Tax=Desulfosarcina alkanivorans TaxID=571177 RepID=A0A5K7YR74_9BACT|nr:hypothetical protein DSCA_43390 [Desulfosarcina alkanivorans]
MNANWTTAGIWRALPVAQEKKCAIAAGKAPGRPDPVRSGRFGIFTEKASR